jgi:YD repeat-containing protein
LKEHEMRNVFRIIAAKRRRALRVSYGRVLAALLSVSVCVALLLPPFASARQGGASRYVYDDAGRLHAVVSANGEGAVYEYDPAGNVNGIRRIASDVLEILAFAPQKGAAGDFVTLVATGLTVGVTSVSFNGTAARIVEATGSAVVAEVPPGATTGPVTIVTSRATATTSRPFNIVARLRVTPSSASLLPGDAVQFTVSLTGASGVPALLWSVNGTDGGSPAVGTISAGGLYTAPALPLHLITVRATSASDPTLVGEAHVTVFDPNTVQAPAAAVSVRRDSPLTLALSAGVSVRNGAIFEPLLAGTFPGVSVRNGSVLESAAIYRASVSLTNAPHVAAVSPASVTRGASVTLNVTGANLSGATSLQFIKDDGAPDSSVTASNLTVNGGGTALTATVTSNTNAALGRHIVVVSTPAGSSRTIDQSINVLALVGP